MLLCQSNGQQQLAEPAISPSYPLACQCCSTRRKQARWIGAALSTAPAITALHCIALHCFAQQNRTKVWSICLTRVRCVAHGSNSQTNLSHWHSYSTRSATALPTTSVSASASVQSIIIIITSEQQIYHNKYITSDRRLLEVQRRASLSRAISISSNIRAVR